MKFRKRKHPSPTIHAEIESAEGLTREADALMDTIVAFNKGEHAVAELIGAKKAREMFAAQEEVAACRRRAQNNPDLLNMRLD
jgi:hypothetical protein